MRHSQHSALLFLCILCLGISVVGIAAAQSGGQGDQTDDTYGAYPNAPTSANQQLPGAAYPSPAPVATPLTATSPAITPITTTPSAAVTLSPAISTQVETPTSAAKVVGAYPGPVSDASTTETAVYYTQAPPATQQNVLLSYNIQSAPPTAVYYSGMLMPWITFYQTFPANYPALWVSTSAGWSWYATCPMGSWVQELMYVPFTGTMKLYALYPDGTTKYYNYGWTSQGYKYRWFYADTPGRHVNMLTVADKPSNYIIIDVT